MKVYYLANARMPTEKAHGIQIAKMCEAFLEYGVDLTLVVPRRKTDPVALRDFYHLRTDIPLIRLPAIDWYTGGRIGYALSSFSFMLSYLFFILGKKIGGERFVLYTVDIDNFSSSLLALFGNPLFSEMHGAKPSTWMQKLLFRSLRGVIAINTIITNELKETFPHARTAYLVEPNGVDLTSFEPMDKTAARKQLGLPLEGPIVLYTGRFFAWKGLEILPQAARKTPHIRWHMVGGVEDDFTRLTGEAIPNNFFFAGSRPHSEMSVWFAAADALIVLGTARDVQSYRYTSPMKLFEYLAAGRPIVASQTPAIQEIVSESEVFFYEPDRIESLASVVAEAVQGDVARVSKALEKAKQYSWRARAERIMKFIDAHA